MLKKEKENIKNNSTEPLYCNNKWTRGRFYGFIRAALRNATRRWPPKYDTLNEAKTKKKVNPKTKRIAQHYKCANCKKDFPQKQVQVDHISPVVIDNFVSWDEFIENLFCDSDNLQVLCITCHKKKSKEENESRKNSRTT